MEQRLEKAVNEARQTFLQNAKRLQEWHRRWGTGATPTEVDIFTWLIEVPIEKGKHRASSNNHGYAHLRTQRVTINPYFVARSTDEEVLDMVLHELGHLFAWKFAREDGHGPVWQSLGFVVGYVPVGCTRDDWRRQASLSMVTYRMAAAAGLPHAELGY